jgi:hypothetical protein
VIGESNIFYCYACSATDDIVRDDDVQPSTELVSWRRVMQYQAVAVDQQAQLVSVAVITTVKSYVEIADDEYRLLVEGDSIQYDSQLIEKLL